DESDDRFFHVGLDPCGRGFFGIAADFADEDYRAGFGIVVKRFYRIEKRCADDWIAADADTGGLADAETGELVYRFVGESSAAADDAYVALFVDASRHDADLAFAGRNDSRAVRSDQTGL